MPPGDARTRSCARCPHPDDDLLQTVHLLPYPRGRRPTTPCASFAEMNGVAVPSPSPLFLTMLDLTPLTSRMWLRDCPATTGQNGRQIAPGSSFSEVSPAITLPSRCLANARVHRATSPVPGSPEPASCKIMTSLTSQHMLQPKIALRGSRPSHATPSTESSASAYFSRNCRRTSSSAFHMPRPAASSSRARTFR